LAEFSIQSKRITKKNKMMKKDCKKNLLKKESLCFFQRFLSNKKRVDFAICGYILFRLHFVSKILFDFYERNVYHLFFYIHVRIVPTTIARDTASPIRR